MTLNEAYYAIQTSQGQLLGEQFNPVIYKRNTRLYKDLPDCINHIALIGNVVYITQRNQKRIHNKKFNC